MSIAAGDGDRPPAAQRRLVGGDLGPDHRLAPARGEEAGVRVDGIGEEGRKRPAAGGGPLGVVAQVGTGELQGEGAAGSVGRGGDAGGSAHAWGVDEGAQPEQQEQRQYPEDQVAGCGGAKGGGALGESSGRPHRSIPNSGRSAGSGAAGAGAAAAGAASEAASGMGV